MREGGGGGRGGELLLLLLLLLLRRGCVSCRGRASHRRGRRPGHGCRGGAPPRHHGGRSSSVGGRDDLGVSPSEQYAQRCVVRLEGDMGPEGNAAGNGHRRAAQHTRLARGAKGSVPPATGHNQYAKQKIPNRLDSHTCLSNRLKKNLKSRVGTQGSMALCHWTLSPPSHPPSPSLALPRPPHAYSLARSLRATAAPPASGFHTHP